MPVFGGSGLTIATLNAVSGKFSATSSSLHQLRTDEDPIPARDFFTSWMDSLNEDIQSKLDSLNEEETKPSPPIIDWTEESGYKDELPF